MLASQTRPLEILKFDLVFKVEGKTVKLRSCVINSCGIYLRPVRTPNRPVKTAQMAARAPLWAKLGRSVSTSSQRQ